MTKIILYPTFCDTLYVRKGNIWNKLSEELALKYACNQKRRQNYTRLLRS